MRKLHVGMLFAVVLVLAGAALASAWPGSAKQGAGKEAMPSFLIVSPHTAEQCVAALDSLSAQAPALLAKMEFGCMAGDHTGYAIVHATNAEAARNLLPEPLRAAARVTEVTQFTPDQIRSFHTMSH